MPKCPDKQPEETPEYVVKNINAGIENNDDCLVGELRDFDPSLVQAVVSKVSEALDQSGWKEEQVENIQCLRPEECEKFFVEGET